MRMEKQERAATLYREGRLTVEEIASELRVSRATVYNWLQAEGISGARRHPGLFSAAEADAVADGMAASRDQQNQWAIKLSSELAEVRRDLDEMTTQLAAINATLNRFGGMVEALVSMGPRQD
jgi:transposase-like protein